MPHHFALVVRLERLLGDQSLDVGRDRESDFLSLFGGLGFMLDERTEDLLREHRVGALTCGKRAPLNFRPSDDQNIKDNCERPATMTLYVNDQIICK